MTSANLFKKKLLPQFVLIIFGLIAYEIIITFPFTNIKLWEHQVNSWVRLILDVFIISVLLISLPVLRDFVIAFIAESIKKRYGKWSNTKKRSFSSIIFYSLTVLIVFIAYCIISKDITTFLSGTVFDTIVRVVLLLICLYFLYRAYVSINKWLKAK